MQTEERTTGCPQCAHQVPVDPQYVTWCDQCDWNVDPTGATGQMPAWQQRIEHRLAQTLYDELEHGAIHRPGWNASRVATYLLSALVLLVPLAGLLGGIALLILVRPFLVGVLFSAAPLAVAFLLRPRRNRLAPDAHLIHRDQAPLLFGLLDKVAEAIGTKPVGVVVLDASPRIAFTKIGWRFTPVVRIGLSLWAGLRPQERVAVLAHELGHGKNGDARHGWVVDSAATALKEIQLTVSEQPLDEYRLDWHGVGAFGSSGAGIIIKMLDASVGGAARHLRSLLIRLDLRAAQRAEYLADRRAAEVAGSDAIVWALERNELADTSYRALERALRFGSDVEPLEAVNRAVSEIPAREVERRLRAGRLRGTRVDATHPPTSLRTKLIRVRPAQHALVELGTDENSAIDRELAEPVRAVLKELRSELR